MTKADIVRNIIDDEGYYYTKHSVLEIVNVIFDEHEAQQTELKQVIQNQSNLLEIYSKDNEVPNNALLIEQLKAKDECVAELKECCEIYKESIKSFIEAHEEIIRNKDKRIEELEEAIKPKTCEGCFYDDKDGVLHVECAFCLRHSNDHFKPKDNE